MILVQLVQKAENLKYQFAEFNSPLDYMRACYGGDSVRPTE